jgi:hypothetical protein
MYSKKTIYLKKLKWLIIWNGGSSRLGICGLSVDVYMISPQYLDSYVMYSAQNFIQQHVIDQGMISRQNLFQQFGTETWCHCLQLVLWRKTYTVLAKEEEKHTLYIALHVAEIGTISLCRHPKLPKQHTTLSPGHEWMKSKEQRSGALVAAKKKGKEKMDTTVTWLDL